MASGAGDIKRSTGGFRALAGAAAASPPLSIVRLRIYEGLLLFIAGAGIVVAGVPPVRGSLLRRVWEMRQAFGPIDVRNTPARANVGENLYEFPKELERPVAPARGFAGVYALPGTVFRPRGDERAEARTPRAEP